MGVQKIVFRGRRPRKNNFLGHPSSIDDVATQCSPNRAMGKTDNPKTYSCAHDIYAGRGHKSRRHNWNLKVMFILNIFIHRALLHFMTN